MAKTASESRSPEQVGPGKPIRIHDHLPGILAGFPAMGFLILAGLQLLLSKSEIMASVLNENTIFWIGLIIGIAWYIAFRFNLPKRRFFMVFGLAGTFIGIPLVLEITGHIKMFSWIAQQLGSLAPSASAGAWLVLSMVFGAVWLCNFVWSRAHLSVTIDESGLTIRRAGGKSERFELIGLKTETEPIDYTETFLLGIGSLTLKTRLNKQIFTMQRVIGLYRIPLMFWRPPLVRRIEQMLSYQGKVVSVSAGERADLAEMADSAGEDDGAGADDGGDGDAIGGDETGGSTGGRGSDPPEVQ